VFFFRRKRAAHPPPKGEKTVQATMAQKRSSFRTPVEFDVMYSLRDRPGRRAGRANDLSAGGLRLSTDEDLLNGSILDLDFQLPEDFIGELVVEKEVFNQTPFGLRPESVKSTPSPFAPMRMSAMILSTFYVPATKSLAHGMKFIDIDQETKEELQRFIHLWQLHQIRLRAEGSTKP
jgi:hypothetical protein